MTPETIDKIIELCEKTLKENPDNATAHHDLGAALLNQKDTEGALKHLTRAAELAPHSVMTYYLLGVAYGEKGQWDEAIASWKQVLERDKRNTNKLNGMTHYFIGKIYALKGMWDAAVMEFNRAQKLVPDHFLLKNALAEVHLAKGELGEAKQRWMEAAAANPQDPRAALNVCAISLDTADYQTAIDYGCRVIAMGQDGSSVRFNLGIAYLRTGDYDKAIEELNAAVSFEPADLGNRLNLGEAYVKKGLIDEGVKQWEQAAADHPESPHPYYNMGVAYAQHNLLQRAEEFWQKALERDPNYLPVHIAQASAYADRGRFEESLKAWRKALEIEPEAVLVRLNIMAILCKQGKYQEALSLVVPAVEKDADVRFVQSICELQLGNENVALQGLSAVLNDNPEVFGRNNGLVQETVQRDKLESLNVGQYQQVIAALLALYDQESRVELPPQEMDKQDSKTQGFWSSLLKSLRK